MRRSRWAERPPGPPGPPGPWRPPGDGSAPGPARHIVDLPPEVEAPPRAIPRRGFGLVLLLAVVIAVAGVAGSRPQERAGQGSAAPSTALPAVGSCLRWDVDPAAPLTPAAGSVVVVDCRQLHQGQVSAAWRPGTLDPAEQSGRCPRESVVWEAGHPASSGTDWDGPVVTRSSTVVADGETLLDFAACVSILRWESGRYSLLSIDRALVAGGGEQSGIPDDARISWCLDDQRRSTGCHQPHVFERVGVFSTDGQREMPATSCQQRARAVVGADGSVSGLAGPSVLTTYVGTTTEETLGGSADVTFLLCDVIAPRGRQLVDTVVGWGSRPLPLR